MPAKMPILPMTQLNTDYEMRAWCLDALYLKMVTRSQWLQLVEHLAPRVPIAAMMSCRTPRGVIYLETAAGDSWRLDHRAHWI